MQIRTSKQRGSVMIICLITAALLGITLASYLDLVGAQNLSTMRSQAWNSSVPLLEAGLEESLTHLYHTRGTNMGVNGWALANNSYYKWRELGDGRVLMSISNTFPPILYAQGYVRTPLDRSNWVVRTVQVNTRPDRLFTHAMVAKGQITFNGNNILVDSFDSADPNYSTNGVYTADRRKDNGHVASNASLVNAISSGNANIWGRAATGPNGTIGIGPNGRVGNAAWQTGTTDGIQPGYSTDDMNVSLPDVVPPFTVGTPISGSGQTIISTSGNYQVSGITGGLTVRSNVHAVLLVDGNINITGSSDKFQIETGGSLQIYMRGATARIGGSGVINQNGNATNFFYWGLPTNTEVTISGNGTFTGVIYAPNAAYTMNGGGSGNEDMTGASVTASTRMNGKFEFHYDENLGRLDYFRGFIVTRWDEL